MIDRLRVVTLLCVVSVLLSASVVSGGDGLEVRRTVMATLVVSPCSGDESDDQPLPATELGETISGLDGERQPLLFWIPERARSEPTPLFLFLHSWSNDFQQDNSKWLRACVERNWIWLHPNFRGVNNSPKACGSKFAREDVLDAIDFIKSKCHVDSERIYLAGVSGGGHMALLMAGHHSDRFSAVSAWVGPTDLADWHTFHCREGKPGKYALMIEQSLEGAPGSSTTVSEQYRDRSPVFHLHRVGDLPVSIWAGVEDGHSGSVPVSHSLLAFNAIAREHGSEVISEEEIRQITDERRLSEPIELDRTDVPGLDRDTILHRKAGNSSVTVFAGGHESVPEAAMIWLKERSRATRE